MSFMALKFENVSKRFHMGVRQRTFFQWLCDRNRNPTTKEFWALRDISFEVQKGDKIALVGQNGAGKTVLLRIAAGIFKPTWGRVERAYPVAPLFNFSLGVDQGLIVRDYIHILSAFYGLSNREVKKRFDAIMAINELEPFLYLPAKHLSSGQKARLNFSIFIQADYAVLAFDEALSVADLNFLRKVDSYFIHLRDSDKTVIMASHELDPLKAYCTKAIWLHHGKIHETGPVEGVLERYDAFCRSGVLPVKTS